MPKLLIIMLFIAHFSYCQDSFDTYNFGYNGMELIVKSKNETIIVSTFNAKKAIKDEIALRVLDYFRNSNLNPESNICIESKDADVFGKFVVLKKNKLTSINFYYEKIEWKNGLVEVYKK